jgi:HD-GYP domain-containing protein (c-di-GMP phosphodiesterase class II)/CheY-like chemotaxis protein
MSRLSETKNNFKKILIVEDNPADARLVKECLKESETRFDLIYAKDLSTAIGLLANSDIDAVLLDLSLPDTVKFEAIDKILKFNNDLPVIILTGLNDKEAAIQTLCMGAQDYIIKGEFDTNQLVRAINYAIERKITENKLKKRTVELSARIKELRLLYDISNITITHDIAFKEVLKKVIDIIQNGFQHPEMVCTRIDCGGIEYKSKNFRKTDNKMATVIQINSTKIGELEVYYLENEINNAEAEFLKEEKELILIIAERLGETYHRIYAEENLINSYDKLKKTLSQTINALASIVETKDPYTSGHQKNVARIAVEIAKYLNLSDDKIETLNIAALIHDIGKINVPASILSKPGKLTEIEFSMIKEHSKTGFDNIKGIDFGYPVADVVIQHHERLNGSGYPVGLKEKDISLEAKILAVADVAEAMTSHRPYRVALGSEKAIEELAINSGILYDKEVVNAFISLSLDVKKINDGEHLCAFYSDAKTQFSYIVPFITGGIESDKKCLYILDENTRGDLIKAFLDAGYSIDKALKSGQLVLYTKRETYIKDGYFEPEKMINLLKETEKQALAEGYSGVRVTGEMTWVLANPDDLGKLIEYENLLNSFIPGSKVSAICQYNEELFVESVLIDVVATHPSVIINGLVYKNNCFLLPEKFTNTARDVLKKKNFKIIKNDITKKILV